VQWLLSVILATQEAEIRRTAVEGQLDTEFVRPYLKNIQHKKGLVEWFR
jgi:hypothetical protein